jgi:hypothetical protein
MKELRKKYDRWIILCFSLGTLFILLALILRQVSPTPQVIPALISLLFSLAGMITMFLKNLQTGKKYANGAKKRRKKILPIVYGEYGVFSSEKNPS